MPLSSRPNIIYIFADQMRFDMMSCAGHPLLRTPYLDRLASEGVRCTEAYSSFPLCSPFRASLMTGKYNHATGLYANHHPLPLCQDFLPERLRVAGYQTGYVGKWHLDGGSAPGFVPPERRIGFEKMAGFNRGHYYMNSLYFYDSDTPHHCPRYEPDYQTEHFVGFMQSCIEQDPENPFFGMICYGAPHFPFNMPEYLKTLYRPEEVPLGLTALDKDLKKAMAQYFKENNFPPASGVWGTGASSEEIVIEDEKAIRDYIALYYGMMSNIDWNVGRILNWLDAHNLRDNTMLVFFSDHSDMCGEHGYRCGAKKNPYASCARIPLLVRWPDGGIAGGRLVNQLIDFAVDAMPTTLEACDLEIPAGIHGRSFLPHLLGENAPERDAVYYEVNMEKEGPERFPIPERGIRTKEWLYVRTEATPLLLFDLKADPDESCNRIADPAYAAIRAELDARLLAHMKETDDDWSAEAVFPPAHFLDHETKTRLQQEMLAEAVVESAPYAWGE